MAESAGKGMGIEQDRKRILEARAAGTGATIATYVKLSGPGWLQSAITLGGGSLAGSLYLGVLGGMALLWLQPLAMIMGIIMLSAISYVTLSTGKRPFQAINEHVNPVLGWGWLIATMMANIVWALPQFSLATAALRQNLLPGVLGAEAMNEFVAKGLIGVVLVIVCATVVWFYNSGSKGIRLFEIILKIVVALIVLSFMGVVAKMAVKGAMDFKAILAGFIPDVRLLFSPAHTFDQYLAAGDEAFRNYWSAKIVGSQRDVMITAAATAVGINMTFLLPYSMLRKKWDRTFRGLAIFDLSTGLFIPFVLATSCVVIASSQQFHTQASPGLLGETDEAGQVIVPSGAARGQFDKLLSARAEALGDDGTVTDGDRRMAAMLVKRDAFALANSLSPLTGPVFARYVFGLGVLGMGISTIIILMLINGFVIGEMVGAPDGSPAQRWGAFLPCLGVLGPFIWSGKVAFWLAVPTSVFGMVLLPIAYFTFYFLMNQRTLLGDDMPRGGKRLAWNTLMAVAAGLATFGSVWSVWSKAHWWGLGGIGAFILLALVVQVMRRGKVSVR